MVKHMSVEEEGFPEATVRLSFLSDVHDFRNLCTFFLHGHWWKSALDKMTTVSKHINEMKKRYDAAIHIQELQSLLRGSEVCTYIYSCTCIYFMNALVHVGEHAFNIRIWMNVHLYVYMCIYLLHALDKCIQYVRRCNRYRIGARVSIVHCLANEP